MCGSESLFFLCYDFCSNNNSKTVQGLTVILAWNWCLSQRRDLRPLSFFIASDSPQKPLATLWGYCPLRRTPFSNLVCMRTHCLISRPKTTVIDLGVRLVHTLTSTAGTNSPTVLNLIGRVAWRNVSPNVWVPHTSHSANTANTANTESKEQTKQTPTL